MDSHSWNSCLSFTYKKYQSRPDVFMGFEEIVGDDDIKEEFPCPFCSYFFGILGLSCHIDEEHPVENKNGVCPVCSVRVDKNLVAHIVLQHMNIIKVKRKRKSRKSGSRSTTPLMRVELQERNFHPIFGSSSRLVSSNAAPDPFLSSFLSPLSSNAAPDPLLSSFIPPLADEMLTSQSVSTKKGKEENLLESNVSTPPLSVKDLEERGRRSEFVHSLLFSAIFDDEL